MSTEQQNERAAAPEPAPPPDRFGIERKSGGWEIGAAMFIVYALALLFMAHWFGFL